VEGFMADPNKIGLLKLLSELANRAAIPEIPWEYVEPSKIVDRDLRRAAIAVLLAQKSLSKTFLKLAKLASGLGDQLGKFLDDANGIIREQQVESKTAESFLLSLLDNIPHSEWDRTSGVSTVWIG
jgi:hypothetical protein